ncbi:MAG: hypothetical protein ACLRTD_26785 [Bacteroides sp.]
MKGYKDVASTGPYYSDRTFSRLIGKDVQQGYITVRVFNEEEMQYRHYESRMRLSTEHFGKLLIVGTQLDDQKIRMAKTQDLIET